MTTTTRTSAAAVAGVDLVPLREALDAAAVELALEGDTDAVIRAGRAAPEVMESWLDTTWREPARFRRSLYRAAAARGSETIKSRPELGLDLYADCIAGHLGHQRPALTIVQDGRGLQEISYETLHARSAALASLWVKSGVKAGESLALLLPVGEQRQRHRECPEDDVIALFP